MARHNGPTGDDIQPFSGIDRGVSEERLAGHVLEHGAGIAVPVDQCRDDTLLGASEAAAVLGLDKYRSPMSVWLAKRAARAGEPPPPDDKPDFVREAAEWGQALEPVIRGKYALASSCHILVPAKSIVRDGNILNPEDCFLRATPDGIVCQNSDGPNRVVETDDYTGYPVYRRARTAGTAGLLQVKTCSAYKADEWSDGVPPAYEVQVRVEMAVCELPWCDVACLIGGQRYVVYRVTRDLKLEANILRDLLAFWQHVLDGTPPPVDSSEAWASYASSKMAHTKVTIQADADDRAYLVELRQARTERKRAERQEAEIKNQLLLKLGAAGATAMDGGDLGRVSAFPNPARMDWKGYAEHLEKHTMHATLNGPQTIGQFLQTMCPNGWPELRERFKGESKGWQIRTPREWSQDEE